MLDRSGNPVVLSGARVATAGAALSMLLMAVGAGWPQAAPPPSLGVQSPGAQAPPQQAAPPQAEPAPPAREENPGLISEMGKLWEKSLSILPTLKSPGETLDDWNTLAKDATRDAGDTLSRIAKPGSLVTGRMKCPVSGNGAPDCKAGADKLCQSKGYNEGKSLNTDSAETCSARVLIPGRTRKPEDCKTDNYVTSALCQ
jgi:hypothetical protein